MRSSRNRETQKQYKRVDTYMYRALKYNCGRCVSSPCVLVAAKGARAARCSGSGARAYIRASEHTPMRTHKHYKGKYLAITATEGNNGTVTADTHTHTYTHTHAYKQFSHTSTHTQTYTHTFMHTQLHIIHTYKTINYTHIYTREHAEHKHARTHTHTHACTNTHSYKHVHTYTSKTRLPPAA